MYRLYVCLGLVLLLVTFLTGVGTGAPKTLGEQLELKIAGEALKQSVTEMERRVVDAGRIGAGTVAFSRLVKRLQAHVGQGHKVLTWIGRTHEVRAIYEPEDGPEAIHLKHDPDESRDDRRIRMECKVEFKLELPEHMRLLYNVPRAGYGMSNIPVHWYFPDDNLWRYVRIGYPDTWTGLLPFRNRTDADGVSTGFLYPRLGQRYGGVRDVAETYVEAVPIYDQSLMNLLDKKDAVFGLAELAAANMGITTKKLPLRIEHHVPTRWTGWIRLTQDLLIRWEQTTQRPGVTVDRGAQLFTLHIDITDIELDEVGSGHGKYTVALLKGAGGGFKRRELKDLDGTWHVETIDTNWKGSGENEQGEVGVKLNVSPDGELFSVVVDDIDIGRKAGTYPWFSTKGSRTVTTPGFEPRHGTYEPERANQPGVCMLPAQFFTLKAHKPFRTEWYYSDREGNEWLPFDPDAESLAGYAIVHERPPWISTVGNVIYEYTTSMDFELRRILPEERPGGES